ncbi:MAG TPA: AMP-binding protein [Usitatibacteraceae bacterium]
MSDADEIRADSMAPLTTRRSRVPLPALLWLGLALSYLLTSASGHRAVAIGIVGLMLGVVIGAAGRWFAGAAVALSMAGAAAYGADSFAFLAYAPPLAAFAFMAVFFQRTLGPGADPLITRVARKEHAELPAEVACYTRTLTRIWVACFVFLLLSALLLAPLLPLEQWSRWVHGLGYVVPGLLFVGEYVFRHRYFREREHGSLPSLIVNIIAVVGEAAIHPRRPAPAQTAAPDMLPLAGYRAAGDPLLLAPEGAMTAATFFARAARLAAALPDAPFVINRCETRAGFMLGFAAALMRGQTSLLPTGHSRSDWEPLLRQFQGVYLLADADTVGDRASAEAEADAEAVAVRRFDLRPWLALAIDADTPLRIPLIGDAQVAAILFTSGSTGQPTAHRKTWGQLCRGAAALAAALRWPQAPACAVVGSVPPQHMFGLEATVMLPWHTGVPVHAQRPLLSADLCTVLAQHPLPSWWMTTAVHMRAPLSAPARMPGLQGVLASTMSVPLAQAIAAEAAWQVPVMEIYGSTETGALAIRRTASDSAWLPLPGVRLWSGAAQGDGLSTGSWAAGAHVEPPVQLGDVLELMSDGRFLLGGRASDLVKVGGKRASLAALNQSLAELPGVDDGVYFFPAEAAPAAANDEANGAQRPVGFYVSQTLSPQQVASVLRARIDPVFIPRPLYRVARLPRNANGKLPQAALIDLLAQCRAQGDGAGSKRGDKHGDKHSERISAAAPAAAIAADHPALAGHFPGDPMVPGVIILARVAEAVRARYPQLELGALLNTRFHAPLKPDQTFTVQAQWDAGGRVRFEMRAETGTGVLLIASGLWACTAAVAPAVGKP